MTAPGKAGWSKETMRWQGDNYSKCRSDRDFISANDVIDLFYSELTHPPPSGQEGRRFVDAFQMHFRE